MESNFERRYAPNWRQTSIATRKASGGYCCYPGCWAQGKFAHHALYQNKQGAIAGKEKPGIHTFWLCPFHHGRRSKNAAHHPNNWNTGALPSPTLDARNSAEYYLKLREGFKEKQRILEKSKVC